MWTSLVVGRFLGPKTLSRTISAVIGGMPSSPEFFLRSHVSIFGQSCQFEFLTLGPFLVVKTHSQVFQGGPHGKCFRCRPSFRHGTLFIGRFHRFLGLEEQGRHMRDLVLFRLTNSHLKVCTIRREQGSSLRLQQCGLSRCHRVQSPISPRHLHQEVCGHSMLKFGVGRVSGCDELDPQRIRKSRALRCPRCCIVVFFAIETTGVSL